MSDFNQFKNSSFERNSKNRPSYYINRFFALKCSLDLMLNRIFPNAKEVTESFAAFEATKFLDEEFDWRNSNVSVVCVGDGVTPRTGATFAYRTRWQCVSVDPAMRKLDYPIQRLFCYKNHIQNLDLEFKGPVLICCVHSHAKLSQCLDHIKGTKISIINMPCCVKPDLPYYPTLMYKDDQIWSEKNLVEIYK